MGVIMYASKATMVIMPNNWHF